MTTWHTFESLLAELPNAQIALSDTVRGLVYKANPSLFDALDFADDHAFLEPALFAYFTAPDPLATLEQLLFSYLPPARKPRRVRVYADTNGAVHIPRVGIVSTQVRGAFCELQWDGGGRFFAAGSRELLPLSGPDLIADSGIPVGHAVDPLLQRFVAHHWSQSDCRVRPINYPAHVSALARGFWLMQGATPALFDAVRAVTRRIVLYNADQPNSFATLSAHGVAFLNVTDDNDEVFFVDDLAHQCGHIMFNALTQEKDRFLARPANTPLRECGGDQRDPRTLYSAFHGLFTYSTILWVLQTCAERGTLSDRQRHEARGRIAFNLGKFAGDLTSLAAPGLFTADGRALYGLFTRVYDSVFRGDHGVARDFDLSDQPYVFDYARFAARNPPARQASACAAQSAWSAR